MLRQISRRCAKQDCVGATSPYVAPNELAPRSGSPCCQRLPSPPDEPVDLTAQGAVYAAKRGCAARRSRSLSSLTAPLLLVVVLGVVVDLAEQVEDLRLPEAGRRGQGSPRSTGGPRVRARHETSVSSVACKAEGGGALSRAAGEGRGGVFSKSQPKVLPSATPPSSRSRNSGEMRVDLNVLPAFFRAPLNHTYFSVLWNFLETDLKTIRHVGTRMS
jgi:hypothetical protein